MKAIIAALVLAAGPLAAHEFWIEPLAGQVAADSPLMADIRVGEDLEGARYAYIPRNFRRFEIAMGDQITPVEGRLGDKPALNMAVSGEGLATVIHVTRDYELTYTDWEKFENFTNHKDFAWAQQGHLDRGLSKDRVMERYIRYGKSLIAVGDGQGADRAFGLEVEIVAQANPYTDDLSAGFPVQVLYMGQPQADWQVELLGRAPDGTVKVTQYRTDADGRAVLPVEKGHFYLVDHVVLRELEGDENSPAWESLWASLTFEVPK
ncbi:DUF4198 domain-containing protein [Tropicibacter naphthalenivorans]|uniref:Nickel uptake substrate-specific transmembrane region n=1 Tax=Tropicibacter naphthalenivorans TaxID=441103 RepID=A0A0P1GI39_9RHOB|nr:DUF4198 domain-containing protein [Tropicibacter naphthalenivorans]CUH75267.1 Nickel uptake substrate-specific transmembrane region [Tropicibacter naphthalenivorans]SMC45333.1 protein of unknown function [Tropicibacter naphthalenivorans]